MRKSFVFISCAVMVAFVVGCALTDYDGIPGHRTVGEAKLWGTEIAFTGFGEDLDGTYSFTAKYDNNANNRKVTIYSYRNPGIVSFSRDGLVDRDGDDVQGRPGDAGGKFNDWVTAVDTAAGTCEFDGNFGPKEAGMWADGLIGVAYCINGFEEEVDKDFELQARFGSLDDLLKQIWSGALVGDFTLELESIGLNGVNVPIDTVSIGATTAANGPARFRIANSPAVQGMIDAILANTVHGEGYSLTLNFAGGLSFSMPPWVQVAFNHDVLSAL